MNIYIPYTYLIGWSKYDKWYYGVRYAKNCNPNDFWRTYFTSSKYVTNFRKKYGEPDIIQIRKIFINAQSALLWESKVLRRLKVDKDSKWLNMRSKTGAASIYAVNDSNNVYSKISKSLKGIKKSENTKNRMSISAKNKIFTAEHKKNMSKALKGKPRSTETKNKISESLKGHIFSDATKNKMSEMRKGVLRPRACCLICTKEMPFNLIPRHQTLHSETA